MPFQSTLPFDGAADVADIVARLYEVPARAGHWDELRDASGALRAPWRRFFGLLGEDGMANLEDAAATVARQIRDNDITYNVYADNGEARPWALDPLPFIVEEGEWTAIERGVAQRARLLEALVADIYGPQTLLAQGLLPPALVFGHPGYLRAMKGCVPPGGRYLQIVAVDLARGPQGEWTVVGHRTQAPSGLGYALENRLIVANLFAEPFRSLGVRRLAPSYSQLIATLAQAARETMTEDERRARAGSPHIALLSPGPFSETYFEHAFLARYLGLTLVEGNDLTVRGDKLYLKTLAGLERVHGLLRRLDDTFCDPVELRADSTIGVPGLLQVLRAGNVVVSNTPGASVVESPALHGFLPGIAAALFGETLALPGVASWWCGEAAVREEAFARLEQGWLTPTWAGLPYPSTYEAPPGLAAGPQRLADWHARVQAAPDAFTIQAPLPHSCTPRYEDGALTRRPSVLRVYAIATTSGGWHVLPGAFTRTAGEQQTSVSMQSGGSSVDTWVLSSRPANPFSLLPSPMKPGDFANRRRTVSSRAAENLFWAGRYSERAENSVRLARLILGSLDDHDSEAMLGTLAELAARFELIPAVDTVARGSRHAFERMLAASLHEHSGTASVGRIIASQARACGEIRARLSNDHWRTILAARNDFRDALQRLSLAPSMGAAEQGGEDAPRRERHESYDRVALMGALETLAMQLSAISGAQGDRMVRDEAWRLLFAGRHIERVIGMTTFLRVVTDAGMLATPAGFDVLLQLFDSTLTYRSLYPGRLEVPALIDLLVVDPTNPRGLYGVYDRLAAKLDEIARAAGGPPMAAVLPLPTLEDLCATDAQGRYATLVALCDALAARVAAASDDISARYFIHADRARGSRVSS
ncbi:circularly permuted type 2 ATP-grasp protein [Trinickia diaoshuihuensis]|uniref:circularly permuted type 2 ATP-grasp protein n=1 Tax=Trinickia diaoshuihuensis TaxID=2292265 RepID=UPI000E24D136|nr:circularly permuted type 2 ATP-grasp protein [Trinickia diaoshuihuensis]